MSRQGDEDVDYAWAKVAAVLEATDYSDEDIARAEHFFRLGYRAGDEDNL